MSQESQILSHLKRQSITPMQALKLYGVFRLAARINDLRMKGHRIEMAWVRHNGKRYARYYLRAK